MQHMDARAHFAGNCDQPLRTMQRRNFIAPNMVRRRIAFNAQIHPLAQAELVFAVESRAAAGVAQY